MPFINEIVLVRSVNAGVHVGQLESFDGKNAVLKNSVRLWYWKTKKGIALSGVAQHGLDRSVSRLDEVNPQICVIDVCEIIPMSEAAVKSVYEEGQG